MDEVVEHLHEVLRRNQLGSDSKVVRDALCKAINEITRLREAVARRDAANTELADLRSREGEAVAIDVDTLRAAASLAQQFLAERFSSKGLFTDGEAHVAANALRDALHGVARPSSTPPGWRTLHPKIASFQTCLMRGKVEISATGNFITLDREAQQAIWSMLLDLQTAAHDAHPLSSAPEEKT